MNGAGKPEVPATFVGVIYNFGEAPVLSEPFARFREAKQWCFDQSEYEDCVWVVLSNGLFEAGGIIDGMFEDDADAFEWEEGADADEI
jgi:hypothetical protein